MDLINNVHKNNQQPQYFEILRIERLFADSDKQRNRFLLHNERKTSANESHHSGSKVDKIEIHIQVESK